MPPPVSALAIARRVASALSCVPVAVVFNDQVATVYRVSSGDMDMAPSLPPRTLCLVRRLRRLSTLAHGQVVAIATPDGSSTVLRRLIALPGDYVLPRDAPRGRERFVPPGFVCVEPETPPPSSSSPPSDYQGVVPVAVVRGVVSRVLPSCKPVQSVPSSRAFPSHNKQLFAAHRQPHGSRPP